MKMLIFVVLSCILTGCAAGAATAGYALRAKTAEELSPAAEAALIEKFKKEIVR